MPVHPSRTVSVSIDRAPEAVYAFMAAPENLPLWASGLGTGVRRDGDAWTAAGPEGPIRIRFAEPNPFGVLDHVVTDAAGTATLNPMRVIPNDSGSEVLFTLFRTPGTSAERFAADADWVARDLAALKALLESR